MQDRVFIDTNIVIYFYSNDEVQKQATAIRLLENTSNAIKIKEEYKLQFYDSLIIATALENSCSILYSEDMQHGQIIENSLKIINPFENSHEQ